jgi:hypothetical protein
MNDNSAILSKLEELADRMLKVETENKTLKEELKEQKSISKKL